MSKNCLNIPFYFSTVLFCFFIPALGYSESGFLPVCQRTKEVILAILAETEKKHCEDVSQNDVSNITSLYLGFYGLHTLKNGDLSGMSGLKALMLNGNNLVEMPVISDSPSLEALYVNNNNLTHLPDILSPVISRLKILDISYNKFTILPDTVVKNIKNFEEVNFKGNPWDLNSIHSGKFLSYDTYLQMVIWQSVPVIDKIPILTAWLLRHLQYNRSQLISFFIPLSRLEEEFILQIPILNVLSIVKTEDIRVRNTSLWMALEYFNNAHPLKETIEELPSQYLSHLGVFIYLLPLSDRREISSYLHTQFIRDNTEGVYLKIASSLIEDEDEGVRANIAEALGEMSPTVESTLLLQRLWRVNPHPRKEEVEVLVREKVGEAFVRQGTPEALSFLRTIITNAPRKVRLGIVLEIPDVIKRRNFSESSLRKYYEIISVMSQDESYMVKWLVPQALGYIPIDESRQLLQRLWQEDPKNRGVIGKALVLHGTPEAFSFLRTIVVNAPVEVRREIADWIPLGLRKNSSDESINGYYEIAHIMSQDTDKKVKEHISQAMKILKQKINI